jgi:hypothetical protein
MVEVNNNGLVLHIRFEGRSTGIPLAGFDVGRISSDREVNPLPNSDRVARPDVLRRACGTINRVAREPQRDRMVALRHP